MSVATTSRLIPDISKSLRHLGLAPYNESDIENSIGDLKAFSQIVAELSKELHTLSNGEVDPVNPIGSDEDAFHLEVSSLLRSLHCPYPSITTGDMDQRFDTEHKKLILLDFLTSEAQAARMNMCSENDAKRKRLNSFDKPLSQDAALLLESIGVPVPSSNCSALKYFKSVQNELKSIVLPELPAPLLSANLSSEDWSAMEQVFQTLRDDFLLRRMLVLKRLDVTILSFRWSSRVKDKQDLISEVYDPMREKLTAEPGVQLGDLLAARSDLLLLEKTSSFNLRRTTQTDITKVKIGSVPDRGGRTEDMTAPLPEMPSWIARQPGPSGQHGSGSYGGRGGGPTHRGGQGGGPPRGGPRGGGFPYRGSRGRGSPNGGGRGGRPFDHRGRGGRFSDRGGRERRHSRGSGGRTTQRAGTESPDGDVIYVSISDVGPIRPPVPRASPEGVLFERGSRGGRDPNDRRHRTEELFDLRSRIEGIFDDTEIGAESYNQENRTSGNYNTDHRNRDGFGNNDRRRRGPPNRGGRGRGPGNAGMDWQGPSRF